MTVPPILVVEDSDDEFYILKRVIKKISDLPLERCARGAEVSEYLLRRLGDDEPGWLPLPRLILLDLNMPGKTGHQVLAELKADPRLRRIPVVIMTTSNNPRDVSYCYDNYASGYVVKPVDLDELTKSVKAILDYWCATVIPPPRVVIPRLEEK
jgi:CheY-like chemotaxis protein